MQVSYGKLKVNDGKEMGERQLPLPCDNGDTIGRCHVDLHGRKRRISAAGKIIYLWPAYKSLPNF